MSKDFNFDPTRLVNSMVEGIKDSGGVKIELSLSPDEAIQIIEFLIKLRAGDKSRSV